MVQKDEKITLQGYIESLSDKSPKRQIIEKIAFECGVSQSTVYRWASGTVVPDKLKKEKLASITGISEEDLFKLSPSHV